MGVSGLPHESTNSARKGGQSTRKLSKAKTANATLLIVLIPSPNMIPTNRLKKYFKPTQEDSLKAENARLKKLIEQLRDENLWLVRKLAELREAV